MINHRVPLTFSIAAPVLSLLLLAGVGIERASVRDAAEDPADFPGRMHLEAADIPLRVGEWVGQDRKPPPVAVALAQHHVVFNRRYESTESAGSADLLFVGCLDARDLVGHFPPFSYPANGYVLGATEERDWLVGTFPVHAKRYHFTRRDERGSTSVVVDSFMVLADGSTTRDLEGVSRSAHDLRRSHFGAAQVQVRTDAAMDDEHRGRVFRDLVEGCLPAIREKSPGVDE